MGLDAVELIMGVEEAFDIEIPDEEAPTIRTVGQMYALVLRKLALIEARPCMSSADEVNASNDRPMWSRTHSWKSPCRCVPAIGCQPLASPFSQA